MFHLTCNRQSEPRFSYPVRVCRKFFRAEPVQNGFWRWADDAGSFLNLLFSLLSARLATVGEFKQAIDLQIWLAMWVRSHTHVFTLSACARVNLYLSALVCSSQGFLTVWGNESHTLQWLILGESDAGAFGANGVFLHVASAAHGFWGRERSR